VKSTSGPTVSKDEDFRTYWLPTTYKEQLDAKTLNLWDDADTITQKYRTDDKTIFEGLTHWKGTMSGSSGLISDKYQLTPQASYVGLNDYRYFYGDAVSFYRLESTAADQFTWSAALDRDLPKAASSLAFTISSAIAIVHLLF